MLRAAAARSVPASFDDPAQTVRRVRDLVAEGWTPATITNQVRARRWQRVGRAVVLHNGQPTSDEICWAALVNCGSRSMFTAFTAATHHGLLGWSRPWVDVLVPGGARIHRPPGIDLRVHYIGSWANAGGVGTRPLQHLALALVRAAGTLTRPRSACGILAAGVQQRLVRAESLHEALAAASHMRHHAVLTAAVADIGQGAHALSEIDFARLCRRHGLPEPRRQAVRLERNRRRYLDVEWLTHRGRSLVVEVDGALHLVADTWWSDQLRQNELVIGGDSVLRYPSVVVRCEELLVVDQLRRALFA